MPYPRAGDAAKGASLRDLFDIGRVSATPAALGALADAEATPSDYLSRHILGDFGDVRAEDVFANDINLGARIGRLLSAYELPTRVRLLVATDLDRADGVLNVTTLMLPEEY